MFVKMKLGLIYLLFLKTFDNDLQSFIWKTQSVKPPAIFSQYGKKAGD